MLIQNRQTAKPDESGDYEPPHNRYSHANYEILPLVDRSALRVETVCESPELLLTNRVSRSR